MKLLLDLLLLKPEKMRQGQREGVRILQIYLKMPALFEFSLMAPPSLALGWPPEAQATVLQEPQPQIFFSGIFSSYCAKLHQQNREFWEHICGWERREHAVGLTAVQSWKK